MRVFYAHEIPIPKDRGQLYVFRNKADGFRYYKKYDSNIYKLVQRDNNDAYLIPEKNITSVHPFLDETVNFFVADNGTYLVFSSIINSAVTKVGAVASIPGPQGPQGAQGAGGSGDNVTVQTLTDGPTITWNVANGINAKVTIAGSRQLAITNAQAGKVYQIKVTQGGAGNFALTLPAGSVVANNGNGVISFTATPGASDLLSVYYDGVNYNWNYGNNYT